MNERDFLRDTLSKGDHCLAVSDLEALAMGGGSEAARQHAAVCHFCTSEVEMIRSFAAATPTEAELAEVRAIERTLVQSPRWKAEERAAAPSLWSLWWSRWAVGGLAAMIAVGVWLQVPGRQAPGLDPGDVTRSTQIELLTALGDVAEPVATLRWQPVEGAARYVVRLEEVDQSVIWEQAVVAPELAVPAESRALMLDRKTLFWVIRAEDDQGRALATSPAREFRVIRGNR